MNYQSEAANILNETWLKYEEHLEMLPLGVDRLLHMNYVLASTIVKDREMINYLKKCLNQMESKNVATN